MGTQNRVLRSGLTALVAAAVLFTALAVILVGTVAGHEAQRHAVHLELLELPCSALGPFPHRSARMTVLDAVELGLLFHVTMNGLEGSGVSLDPACVEPVA